MSNTSTLLDKEGIDKSLTRISHEIIEHNKDLDALAIIGIHRGGSYLAKRLHQKIQEAKNVDLPIGFVDISLYRDDVAVTGHSATPLGSDILFDVNGKTIILVDDVLFTGRTIRCALDQIIDFGRPKQIQLAVLVDRGHRELPIKADYIGKNVPTSLQERVKVHLVEDGGEEMVVKSEGEKV